jgi:hypothetical protein
VCAEFENACAEFESAFAEFEDACAGFENACAGYENACTECGAKCWHFEAKNALCYERSYAFIRVCTYAYVHTRMNA